MKKSVLKKSKMLCAAIFAGLFGSTALMGTATAFAEANKPNAIGNYYASDYDTRAEVIKASEDLNEDILEEGATMLKNEDNALPLGKNAKISVFGKNSVNVLLGGSGSGEGGGGSQVSLQEALRDEGFQINGKLTNFYNDNSKSGSGRGTAPSNGTVPAGYNTGETPVSSYTEDITSSFEEYSDAAVVVISRIGGEGFDLPRTMRWNGSDYRTWTSSATQTVPGARSGDDHYLQLDQNEADLIKFCGEHFDKVVVLLNTGSQFESGFLDDEGHYAYHQNTKAGLWIGYPGGTGLRGVAKILSGEINPSGRTTDTYARDFTKDPTYKNFGNNLSEYDSSRKGNQYSNLPGSGGNGGGGYSNNYVIYKEGIYMGYRYYETRGYTEGAEAWTAANDDGKIKGTTTTTWDNWYDAHVVYPFGHGLSYTTFTQEIVESTPADNATLAPDGTITVKVKVTNTGKVAGKETVQLYYTAPYTTGGIEKSHVVLGAYEKTSLLGAGDSEIVTLTLTAREMSSYDWNDANKNSFKGYELEHGEYEIKIMRDAHETLDSVKLTVSDDNKYETSETTGNKIENRFDKVSNYLSDELNENYMSRADFEGTFPTTAFRIAASDWVKNGLNAWKTGAAYGKAYPDEEMPWYTDEMPTTGASNNVVMSDLVGKDYDDPLWDKFLDQLTVDQLKSLVLYGGYASGQNYSNLGITRINNADGPAGFCYGAPSGSYMLWCCDTVLGATWNKELAYEKGKLMGNQALWGNGDAYSKIVGWYAPAVNIHRSPFSGRNFEYFSEDGYISGMMASYCIKGAQEKGLFCYVKHFGVNDQESNRCGLLTWLNEQSMREIYIRPFELAVKVGETRAMMSSLNRIGFEWAGGCYGLLTQILRDEWGFQGNVVTDSYAEVWGPADQMIRGGGNLALGSANLTYNPDSATTVSLLRKSAHGLLYAHANSLAMNAASQPVMPKPITSFEGASLRCLLDGQFSEDIATAKIATELYPDAVPTDVVYTLAEGSRLPEGLTLTTDGRIKGTPTEEIANHHFTINATFQGYTKSADFMINVVNENGAIVYEGETNLAPLTIGETIKTDLAFAEIYKPDATEEDIAKFPEITYSLQNGSLLPAGLRLMKSGQLVGTPTLECENYTFTVVASALGYKDVPLTFTVSVYNEMTFEGNVLANGKIGQNYAQRITPATTESTHNVTYALAEGSTLPEGLTLTSQGYIIGTPLVTVTDHAFTVVASSDYATDVTAEYKISIGLAFNDLTIGAAQEGAEYVASVDAAQGATEIAYALKEGSELPAGLELSADGKITGTPEKAGVYKFTVVATAEGKLADEMEVTLYVANAQQVAAGCNGSVNSVIAVIIASIPVVFAAVVIRKKREN